MRRGQLGNGKGSDGGRALAVVVEDSLEGHGVKSEERSVLHVVHPDGRHAAREFCRYDGIEAEELIRGYEKVGRGRKERGEKKGEGEVRARREEEGTCGGRAPGTCFIFHCRNANHRQIQSQSVSRLSR